MNIQKLAKLFGIAFIAIGVLGFVPGITTKGYLLGLFQVDAMHNIIHLLSGIIALMCAGSMSNAKMYFKIFGIVYALVTIIGVISKTSVLGIIDVNKADNLLHFLIAAAALIIGFGGSRAPKSMPSMTPPSGGQMM